VLSQKKKILFAVLNWGLGHATRSWELINQYINAGDEVILASDGLALEFLKLEFPSLSTLNLPSYNARYAKDASVFQMLKNGWKTQIAVRKEHQVIQDFLQKNNIDLIISDNRYGIYNHNVKSIIITHQLNIKAPFGERIVNAQNHKWLNNFDEIWVPDSNGELSGELSQPIPKILESKVKEIGWLSRFEKEDPLSNPDKIVVIASGPEPQKSILIKSIKEILLKSNTSAVLYTGDPSNIKHEVLGCLTIKSHALKEEFLEDLKSAKVVIGRSGYSSIMDYKRLGKKMVLIPTPGQDEQIYLGNYLSVNPDVTMILQKDLTFVTLKEALSEFL